MAERESWRAVGERVRHLRKESGLTLRQLGVGCSLSSNAISLVERGRVAPTIETLCKIAHALGVSVSSLFQEACPADVVISRAADGLIANLTNDGMRSLSAVLNRSREAAGAQTVCGISAPISQTVLCICGRVDYEVDDKHYQLDPGDSLTFMGDGYQRWRNPGSETGIAVMIFPPTPAPDD